MDHQSQPILPDMNCPIHPRRGHLSCILVTLPPPQPKPDTQHFARTHNTPHADIQTGVQKRERGVARSAVGPTEPAVPYDHATFLCPTLMQLNRRMLALMSTRHLRLAVPSAKHVA
jgi:hypothetical protein